MTLTASIHVPETLQSLIDCRLDTIDRMLLGRLPRSDRMEIVREVESQIYELLGQRADGEPTREDVLHVLGQLDPPEAYLPDAESSVPLRPQGRGSDLPLPSSVAQNRYARLGLVSGILGISTMVMLLFLYPAVLFLSEGFGLNYVLIMVVWFGIVLSTLTSSIIGLVLAGRSRLSGGWAVTGLITCVLALFISIIAGTIGLIGL